MDHSELFKPEFVQGALDRYKYNTVEDMYASIGFGAISSGKVIARILEEYRKVHKEENVEEKIEELSKSKPQTKPSKSGIIVKGIDNCLVKLSKCCNPVPGDNIVGYITRGRGVSIHRANCKNIKDFFQDEESRMIDVSWVTEKKASYNVDIEVFSNDRDGLLADIISKISATKSKLIAISSRANKEKIVTTELTVEVENLEELNEVLKAIRKVDSVYEVKRRK